MNDAASTAAEGMVRRAPVGASKELRDGIEAAPIEPRRAGVYIGAFYWFFVNYGTSKMAAQPFVEPGLQEGVREFRRARL